ncbi:ABC transporter permease [soil metagenome]
MENVQPAMTTRTLSLPDRPRRSFAFWHEVVLAVLLVGVMTYAGSLAPKFLSLRAQISMAGELWPLALLTLSMTLIILTAGIDLSVGSTAALSAVVLGLCYQRGTGMPIAITLALATGIVAGFINGILIARVRVHPLIVTLATLSAYRGIALAVTQGQSIHGFPQQFLNLSGSEFLGLPLPGWLFVIGWIVTGLLLWRTVLGRWLYAMGFNPVATRFSGVPTRGVILLLYTLSGFIAAVAAILLVSRYDNAKADLGTGLELSVITATVLGGVSIFGGRGNTIGVLLGVALIHECQKFVIWHYHRSELNALVIGALLIGSVLINSMVTARRRS